MAFRMKLLSAYISICILVQYHANADTVEEVQKPSSLGFSWNNCGSGSDILQFQAFSINPTQVRLPGTTVVGGTINVLKPFPAQITAHVEMHAKIFGTWVHVPCEGSAGSCSYNLCSNKTETNKYINLSGDENGPKRCPPLPPAVYSISNYLQQFKSGLPIKVSDTVKMDINLNSDFAGHIGCIHIEVDVKT